MSERVRVGIAGLGTVGCGTVGLLRQNAALLKLRAGKDIEVTAVSARNKSKVRSVDLSGIAWHDDPVKMADDANVDIIVELMGGSEGAARELVSRALSNGKHVVTANKALIAHHGLELAKIAESKQVVLAFEAAVAGGIPIIGTLRDGLGANKFSRIAGILNGTCNYILTTMHKQGRDFSEVLKEAQDLGYAEADPSFDVDGIDTAHKLAIITSLAFGTPVNIEAIHCEGIRQVTCEDMKNANELGYVIKLLGITERNGEGVLQRVHPCLVRKDAPIGVIDGAFNAIHLEGNAVGRILIEGKGAGEGPTASSVVADILQIARGIYYKSFTVAATDMKPLPTASMDSIEKGCYLRFTVRDEAGVLADITSIFAREKISVQSLIQHSSTPQSPAQIIMTTHATKDSAMNKALKAVDALDSVIEATHKIRIEDL